MNGLDVDTGSRKRPQASATPPRMPMPEVQSALALVVYEFIRIGLWIAFVASMAAVIGIASTAEKQAAGISATVALVGLAICYKPRG